MSASAAVMLGLALLESCPVEAAEPVVERADAEAENMQILQRSIIQWYAAGVGGRRPLSVEDVTGHLKAQLPDDPGAEYVLNFAAGDRPASIAERARQIDAALKTSQRSLCLIGLGWRDVTEWCLDHGGPVERTQEEQAALRGVLTRLSSIARAWRMQIFEEKLDPFLRRPSAYRRLFITKAGPPPRVRLEGHLASKRGWQGRTLRRELVKQQRYGDVVALAMRLPADSGVVCIRDGETKPAGGTMRVFDILRVPQGDGVRASFRTTAGEIEITLPSGMEVTYGDVLRLAMEQPFADTALKARVGLGQYRALGDGHAFALPVLRERVKELEAAGETLSTSGALRQARWLLTNLYLF